MCSDNICKDKLVAQTFCVGTLDVSGFDWYKEKKFVSCAWA